MKSFFKRYNGTSSGRFQTAAPPRIYSSRCNAKGRCSTVQPYCSASEEHCCFCRDKTVLSGNASGPAVCDTLALYHICGSQYLARPDFFESYCDGCRTFYKGNCFTINCPRTFSAQKFARETKQKNVEKAKKVVADAAARALVTRRPLTEEEKRQAELAKWRSGLDNRIIVNFVLREIFPFELCHIVLAYALKVPLVRFFLIYDAPEKQKVKCGHPWCELEFSDHCCFCLDKRFEKQRGKISEGDVATASLQTRWYIDGQGNYNGKMEFYQHYCPGCNDKYAHDGAMASTMMRDRLTVKQHP